MKAFGLETTRIIKDSVQGVTKTSIRKMARRGGVKRISSDIYDETRNVLKDYLTGVSCSGTAARHLISLVPHASLATLEGWGGPPSETPGEAERQT